MSSTWLAIVPIITIGIALVVLFMAKSLQFFSRAARHLDQIDIPNEVGEIRINELDALVGDRADRLFKDEWKITRWERRRAVTRRHEAIRKWLHLLISNSALFCEVARFHIQETAEAEAADGNLDQSDLPFRVMDRATMVQFMAAVCLVRLRLFDCCRLVRPFYVPQLSGRFQVRDHDLIAWYRHLGKEMLELTQHYYDDITYTRFIYQLTGAFTLEEAAELHRL